MIKSILTALEQNHIDTFLINEEVKESIELFFIKKNLDMRRQKNVHHYNVTVYHDFVKDTVKMRGSSSVGIHPGMTENEISETIKKAYYAASFVCNPYYDIPSGSKADCITVESTLAEKSLTQNASIMTEALFAKDTLEDTFMNSAELFLEKTTTHIVNSNGIDVSYIKYLAKGEFVVQCISPQDVETYQDFSYDNLDTDALKAKVKRTIERTAARAKATTAPQAGEYTIILSDQYVKELFRYYLDRSSASLIYPKYSNYAIDTMVQGDKVEGELLNVTLKATTPYSIEGIPMKDRTLLSDGKLKTIHGASRYCYYLGINPTGTYSSVILPEGSKSLEEMKSGKYLHVVNFSDFQMDSFSGHFGGEIRLAFLCDGNSVTPVTGGSINGSLLDVSKNFVFSKEMQIEKGYEGPLAVRLENVKVAGA